MSARFWHVSSLVLAALLWSEVGAQADDERALELFQRRITPILRSPKPSSCAECHLSGVDLKDYIGESQEATFAALKSAGLIDIDRPDESKLLQLIARAPEQPTLVGQQARQQEFEALRAWIRTAVKDPQLAAAKSDIDQLGPSVPLEVIRHTRQDRVLASFVENIWSEVGRCVGCHSPEMNRNQIGRNGLTKEDVEAISWVVPRDPAATLGRLVESGNIDTDNPDASQVLTKPAGLEKHGGGPKFSVGSRTDKNFRRFLNDYAAIVGKRYQRADQLPAPHSDVAVLTGQHLRITELPAQFDQKLLRVDLFRWDGNGWSKTAWGTADGPINGKQRVWQSMVFATAPRDSARAPELTENQPLPAGRYLLKIYVDQEEKCKADRDYELGEAEFYGQVEADGEWKPGYQPPKIVRAPVP